MAQRPWFDDEPWPDGHWTTERGTAVTDGEPEPFSSSADADESDASLPDQADDPTQEPADDEGDGAESIADLIDEASRTAAEQAVQEVTGTAPVDRSAEVWGLPTDGEDDLEDVWSAAAERHAGRHVFDTFLGDDDEAWAQATGRTPAAAEPAFGVAGTPTEDDEPDVFLFAVAEPGDEPHDTPRAADDAPPTVAASDEEDVTDEATDALWGGPTSGAQPEDVPAAEATDALWGGPTSGAQPEDVPAAEAVDDQAAWGVEQAPDPGWDDQGDDEPDPFRFAAGTATSAPAPVPDHVTTDDEPEPDTFAFAVDEDEDAESVPEPSSSVDEPEDDGIWRGSAADDGFAFEVTEEPSDDDVPLADTASPRSDAGWHDLDADQATWSLPDLPRRSAGGDEEPERFTASLDAPDEGSAPAAAATDDPLDASTDEDDEPWTAATHDRPEAGAVDADSARGDGAPAAAAPDPALGRLDDLDDGLDHFDDLGGAPADTGPDWSEAVDDADVPAALDDAPAPAPSDLDDMPPPAAPPPAVPEPAEDESEESAPRPTGLTFSSARKPKKRGFFGG